MDDDQLEKTDEGYIWRFDLKGVKASLKIILSKIFGL